MKVKQLTWLVGAALCVALVVLSGVLIYQDCSDAKRREEEFDYISSLVIAEPEESDIAPPQTDPDLIPETKPPITAREKYAAVFELNSDFVGWIRIDGTNINYPVMQSVNHPNYYLKHSFEKTYSNYGVPYVQENCDIETSDNLIIYGHHMNNGSMFADLCKYTDIAFYREHKMIQFDTLSDFGEYEIVAVFKTVAYSASGFFYNEFVNAIDEEEFATYITRCKELSLYDTEVSAEYGDRFITLSTCEYSRTNGRMVVVAKRTTDEFRQAEA